MGCNHNVNKEALAVYCRDHSFVFDCSKGTYLVNFQSAEETGQNHAASYVRHGIHGQPKYQTIIYCSVSRTFKRKAREETFRSAVGILQ